MDKLLLIDDEDDVRYSFKRIFDSPGLELETGAPVLSVPLAAIDTAFGGRPAALTVNVAQVSDRYGPGETVSLSLDL